jgi:hypothetical protein
MNTTPVFAPAVLLVSLCAACSSSEAPSPEPTSVATESNAVSPPAAALDAGYFSCSANDECVAVPYIPHCCFNGFKIAVARSEAAAFEESESCDRKRVICPLFMVDDTRVPACNPRTHECEMVPRDAGPASPLE